MLKPVFDVETFHTRRELPRFLGLLLRSDLLFFGGGSIIKELYASIGRNRYSTLLMILASVTFTKLIARKKVIMSNIGVGPLLSPFGRRLAFWILNQVDFLSVRDPKSFRTCQELKLDPKKYRQVADAVFVNPPEVFIPAPGHLKPFDDGKLHIALNLNYDIENRSAWEPFLSNLGASLEALHRERPLVVHALPMQSKFKAHDDLSELKSFLTAHPELPAEIADLQTAREAGELIARCDMVLAERLHTLVIASILGKPFFGLVYDVKVQELLDYLGMSNYSLNINQPFPMVALLDGIREVLDRRKSIREDLLTRSFALRADLECYFGEVRTILNQTSSKR